MVSNGLTNMVDVRHLSSVFPLPNGHSWLINGGDPNHVRSRDDPPSATQKKSEGEVHDIFLLDWICLFDI